MLSTGMKTATSCAQLQSVEGGVLLVGVNERDVCLCFLGAEGC